MTATRRKKLGRRQREAMEASVAVSDRTGPSGRCLAYIEAARLNRAPSGWWQFREGPGQAWMEIKPDAVERAIDSGFEVRRVDEMGVPL